MRALAFTFAFAALRLVAQTPTPEPPQTSTLTVTTRLVTLDAVVRDAHGALVTNLTKDDFMLHEDGHVVPIRYFNHDSDLPLTIGLLVDTSGSETEYFSDEALGSSLFLENVLRQTPSQQPDRAFIVRFDSQVLLLQAMTSSLPQLRNGLRLLDYKPDTLKNTRAGGTLLFDAIVNVCDKVVAKETGRRALIIMTDGDDNRSSNDLFTAIHSAQSAGVAIYSILYTREDPNYPNVGTAHPSGIGIMQQISHATGGREFIVGRSGNIRQIYAAIEADLRSQYRISFTPTASKPHRFHPLDLRTTNSSYTVQSRTSYSTPE